MGTVRSGLGGIALLCPYDRLETPELAIWLGKGYWKLKIIKHYRNPCSISSPDGMRLETSGCRFQKSSSPNHLHQRSRCPSCQAPSGKDWKLFIPTTITLLDWRKQVKTSKSDYLYEKQRGRCHVSLHFSQDLICCQHLWKYIAVKYFLRKQKQVVWITGKELLDIKDNIEFD